MYVLIVLKKNKLIFFIGKEKVKQFKTNGRAKLLFKKYFSLLPSYRHPFSFILLGT